MPKKVALDQQVFSDLRRDDLFYVDKTDFIREWWNARDRVSLILRPRRFGKTLMLSTVEAFLSTRYAGRADLFEGLDVWKDADMRALQGTVPVISLSLASVKPSNAEGLLAAMNDRITTLYSEWRPLLLPELDSDDLEQFRSVGLGMAPETAKASLLNLSKCLARHYGRNAVILLDEYDTPMIEAWTKGFWDEAAEFMRGLFNATFKTNPWLERGLMTGITRVGKESIFSDLNNLAVCSVTDDQYATSFGFTEKEVFDAMDERGLTDREGVRRMYDGFSFGGTPGIYNPWSVTCYLKSNGKLKAWWANSSSNALVGELVRKGDSRLKRQFTTLMEGGTITTAINDRIVFDQLADNPVAVWTLLVAAGYLKPVAGNEENLELALTNGEVLEALDNLLKEWFAGVETYSEFLDALMRGDLPRMNKFMSEVVESCFSYFNTGSGKGISRRREKTAVRSQPERFYHGFVLGLLADLRTRYIVTSDRESGFGRYDVMLEPCNPAKDDAFIFEFKVLDEVDGERSLEDTVANALSQIDAKDYARNLLDRGIPAERIRKYGFAFRGKEVLIGRS